MSSKFWRVPVKHSFCKFEKGTSIKLYLATISPSVSYFSSLDKSMHYFGNSREVYSCFIRISTFFSSLDKYLDPKVRLSLLVCVQLRYKSLVWEITQRIWSWRGRVVSPLIPRNFHLKDTEQKCKTYFITLFIRKKISGNFIFLS